MVSRRQVSLAAAWSRSVSGVCSRAAAKKEIKIKINDLELVEVWYPHIFALVL
jgi:hypothetical protein